MPNPFDQSRYQVRFEWGDAGRRRLEPADVTVVVDVLRFCTTVADRVAAGESVSLAEAAHAGSWNGAALAGALASTGTTVLLGCLRNASAVADAVLAEQMRRGARTSVAVLAAGELAGADPGAPLRFAVEDQLGAGAVIDALALRGLDHSSPEAAAACEALRGLRGAVRHLLTASGSGQELLERGRGDEVRGAAELDAVDVVPVLRAGVFERY
ncbi:2-phosphosulfolactate phosphatase [Microbacterium sp. zg.Y625]|uniref:2-phosphosulfolactate phosphatase n=1 Tax=Microbacterium jiangjiandongii TaxID=3049071 RepID=UPI00214BC4CE|nr:MULTISPECIES: 2-phosphosulfolactate phosphatase [unclassified Microbacterium]MCR2793994.1 2-phosphosulfolactate phosphatase [Microbacterium sp. zg.Y625]WIM25796.1 2-phosphosulfolactate phosphatase [Microbacterium sp. zg-Y625]